MFKPAAPNLLTSNDIMLSNMVEYLNVLFWLFFNAFANFLLNLLIT
jgi:hypothetical protein